MNWIKGGRGGEKWNHLDEKWNRSKNKCETMKKLLSSELSFLIKKMSWDWWEVLKRSFLSRFPSSFLALHPQPLLVCQNTSHREISQFFHLLVKFEWNPPANCCCSSYWFVWSGMSLSSVNQCVRNIFSSNQLNLIMYQSISSRKQQTEI